MLVSITRDWSQFTSSCGCGFSAVHTCNMGTWVFWWGICRPTWCTKVTLSISIHQSVYRCRKRGVLLIVLLNLKWVWKWHRKGNWGPGGEVLMARVTVWILPFGKFSKYENYITKVVFKDDKSDSMLLDWPKLTIPKPLTVWITTNGGKFWKRWEHQTTWPASWETYVQVRKQQLEMDME